MRKIMIRNTLLMLLVSAVFAGALLLYLRSASPAVSTTSGETFTSSATGFCSDVTVTATYSDGALTALTIDATGETPTFGGAAAESLEAAILAAGGIDGVDAVAGSTMTSDAVFAAFADCAAQGASGGGAAGGYTATETGFCSDVTVTADFADGALVSISIDATGETPDFGGAAAESLEAAILAAGGIDGVDAVAGSTFTSDAVFAAYADCAAQAG